MSKPKVLFVCLGNICRSPTAEAVFRHKASAAGLDVYIDSAGTGGWHQGDAPDSRAIKAGSQRGYSFAGQSARAVEPEDYRDFDHILAMDRRNLSDLKAETPAEYAKKIKLFLSYGQSSESEVPDPYYGGGQGFEQVLDLIEDACEGLIKSLQQTA